MYAFIDFKGKQYKVIENKFLYVPFLNLNRGDTLIVDNVLSFQKAGETQFGAPYLNGISVHLSVLEDLVKGDKVIVFKKKGEKDIKKKQDIDKNFLSC